ncbi:MAG TPA: hypothetical protein VHE34_09790 [Puia sp.]|uniref:hypothetical protein n=1 Tax=Puia sp. TaxID=2045100 RepID=UPI002B886BCE|nr:hypothetical protein [Puia sp.]HVU95506.1 hypothetical protein [Puia sp.]
MSRFVVDKQLEKFVSSYFDPVVAERRFEQLIEFICADLGKSGSDIVDEFDNDGSLLICNLFL